MIIDKRQIIMGVLFEPGTFSEDEIIKKIAKVKGLKLAEVEDKLKQQGIIHKNIKTVVVNETKEKEAIKEADKVVKKKAKK